MFANFFSCKGPLFSHCFSQRSLHSRLREAPLRPVSAYMDLYNAYVTPSGAVKYFNSSTGKNALCSQFIFPDTKTCFRIGNGVFACPCLCRALLANTAHRSHAPDSFAFPTASQWLVFVLLKAILLISSVV